jgi:sortase A
MARLLSRFERVLLVVGVSLIAVYATARLRGEILSRLSLLHFEDRETAVEQGSPMPSSPLTGEKVGGTDVSLWSMQRIEAYKRALLATVDTPEAVLTIPRLGVEVAVFEGTDDLNLNRGAGRIAGTAKPGQPGNMGIAAHRDGFFRALKDIQIGDEIEVRAPRVKEMYRVDNIEIVNPNDVSVLHSRPHSSVTLVTCYPFYFVGHAPQRFIVQASITASEQSQPQNHNASRKEKKENIQ